MKDRLPPFSALRAFEAVARHGSFKSAAIDLNVTPSAISHQIKRLEEDLNCQLMRRSRDGVQLTPQGARYAAIIGRSIERIAEASADLRWDSGSCLTLQTYSTFASRWLIGRLPALEKQSSGRPLRLVTSQADVDLVHEPIDACVYIGAATRPDLDYTFLFSSRVFPVCSQSYLKDAPPLDHPQDLQNHALLQVYPSPEDWPVWLTHADVGNVAFAGDSRFDSYDHALHAAARGFGVALAMEPFAEDDLTSGRLIELFPGQRAPLHSSWYFVCLRSRRDEPKIVHFREWLLEEIASDPALSGRHGDIGITHETSPG